ncbi:MAG: hypothetical protein KGY74_10775 [Candidatus Cloacimonetes bacterium]|nr:hypothetical protein [Candidatus Cloacimonadota bacterium]
MKITATKKGVTVAGITFKVKNKLSNILVCVILAGILRDRKAKRNPLIKNLENQFKEKI